jgi:YVTN family beta-propeller protein
MPCACLYALLLVVGACGGEAQPSKPPARKSPTAAASSQPARPGPRVIAKIETGQGTGLVAAFASIWTADHRESTVSRIDPQTNRVIARIPIGELPYDVAAGDGAVHRQPQHPEQRGAHELLVHRARALRADGGRRVDPELHRCGALRGQRQRSHYRVHQLRLLTRAIRRRRPAAVPDRRERLAAAAAAYARIAAGSGSPSGRSAKACSASTS